MPPVLIERHGKALPSSHATSNFHQKESPMPKNEVTDPITDQEIAFAHLVLSGTMTDGQAAEAAGLNPDTAAYTKAKPRVRAYMLEHRTAVRQKLVEQETEELRRHNTVREQVLTRLWEIAKLSPELTRNSVTGQVKALSMIIAIEALIPDRRAGSSEKESAPPPNPAKMYRAAWLHEQQGKTTAPQPSPDPVPDKEPDPSPAADAPSDPNESIPVPPVIPSEAVSPSPYARVPDAAPDLRLPFHIQQQNRFGRRR
jgi:hypothetical protein